MSLILPGGGWGLEGKSADSAENERGETLRGVDAAGVGGRGSSGTST